jgi:hypothetical protein
MHFRHNSATSGNIPPIIGMMVDGASLVFRFNPTNNDVTLVAGYVIGTSTVQIAVTQNVPVLANVNTWRHVAMIANIAATDGFASLYVDGVKVAEWTGDTRLYRSGESTPRTAITGIYAAGTGLNWPGAGSHNWGLHVYVDDFYADFWDGVGTLVNAPPPTRRFLAAFPNGAGSSTQWTPSTGSNWQNVDEAPPNDETDFNRAQAPNLLDLYAFSDVTVPLDHAVRAVIPIAYARKSDAGVDSQVRVVAKTGANIVKSDAKALPTSYGYVWERWTTQADGASAWTEAAVNAAEFGVESAGTF